MRPTDAAHLRSVCAGANVGIRARRLRVLNVIKRCRQGMPGGDRRHLDLRPEGGARARRHLRLARQTRSDRLRPRNRVHLQRYARLGSRQPDRLAFHCAGKTDAERDLRSVQRPPCVTNCSMRRSSTTSITSDRRWRDGPPYTIRSALTWRARLSHPRRIRGSLHRNGRSAPTSCADHPLLAAAPAQTKPATLAPIG